MPSKFEELFAASESPKPLPQAGDSSGSLESLFEEIPVSLDVFIKDRKYLGLKGFTPSLIQADLIEHVERIYYPNLYPRLAEHELYWSRPVRQTNFHVAQWGKGSKSPETLTYVADTGQWVKLRDLKASRVASAYPENGVVFASEATDSFLEGHGEMFRVTTASGRVTDVWEGHRFLTWGREKFPGGQHMYFAKSGQPKWQRLWDMSPGDHIAVSSYVPEPEITLDIDSREVALVGLWLGDGCMPMDRTDRGPTIAVGYKSPRTKEEYIGICDSYSGVSVSVWDDPAQNKVTLNAVHESHKTHLNPVREVCFKWGLDGKRAATKRIPEEFFSLSNKNIALLVSRLIDTDGWVTHVSDTCEIGYGSISKGLVEDIQKLLLRLGVFAEVKQKNTVYKGEPYTSWQLRVRKTDMVQRLAEQLTLLDKEDRRLAVLDRVKNSKKHHAMHGDLMWDRIKSIEPLGWGEYWTTTVDGPASYISDGGILDHNSGKDSSIRFAFLRVAYLFMCLKEPQLYYGMPEDDDVHMLNVAISSTQAQNAFFNPLKKNIRRGYFASRAESTMGQITFDKGLIGVSGHSRAESQEGLNLLFGVCDEIDGFKTKAEIARTRGSSVRDSENTAEHIMNMMKSSSTTRFAKVFKQVYISYPRYLGSTIQNLTAAGLKDIEEEGAASQWYVSGPYSTWDVKPSASKRDFWDEYKKDPIEAAAKYECKPRHAADPYYKNILAVEACMREEDEPAVRIEYSTDGTTWTPKFIFRDDFYPIVGAHYAMHADMATKGDRAGIAMSHITRQESVTKTIEGERGEFIEVTEQEAYVRTDFVLAIEADISIDCVPPREIQMRWARDLWAELQMRGFHIPQFSFDGYQSLESRQGLEALGVESPLISTDKSEDPWKLLRDLMEGSRISVPKNLILTTELLGLTKKPNGKVDHTTFSGKDLADALACSATGAIMVGGQEDPGGARAYYTRPEFLMGQDKSPEMQMIEHDPFNFGTEGFDFGTEVTGYGWDPGSGVGEWI